MVRDGKKGRGSGFRGGRGERGGKRRDNRQGKDNRVSYDKIDKSNDRFERFYNDVLGLSDEERVLFWEAMRRELPNSFRFAGSKRHALAVQKLLKQRYIPEISSITHLDGSHVEPPQAIPWYPDELAWWMTTPKSVVRRFPPFSAFQKYLVSETSVGNISRQEAVSMIPPLVMDLKPGMTALDMCAAPGSKAAQLLEMIHVGEEARMRKSLQERAEVDGRARSSDVDITLETANLEIESDDDGRATGLLIANDSDYKRSHLLIHQLKRLSSPNLLVTNHDATLYPSIKLPPSKKNPSHNQYLKFDRILADVPCSGDGTARKNVNLWKDWNPGSAIGLHGTQVRILVRALQMLKSGGRVVYSTCSMNPMENEAVVATAIAQCGGLRKIKLVPTDDKLPLLRRRPGLKSWSIIDKSGRIWPSWDSYLSKKEKQGCAPEGTEKFVQGMFSPSPSSPEALIPFENCMRIYAHQQDTGGFFVAILEKICEIGKLDLSQATVMVEPGTAANPLKVVSSQNENLKKTVTQEEGECIAPGDWTKELDSIPPADPDVGSRQDADSAITADTNAMKRSINEVEIGLDEVLKSKKLKSSEVDIVTAEDSPKDPAHSALKAKEIVSCPENNSVKVRPNRNRFGAVEEPFKYIASDHVEVQAIESFYKLSGRFPRDRFMVRNATGQPAKTIYYTTKFIREILTENEGNGIKFIHGGVKMFMKQDVQAPNVCRWRIQSEGMPILEGYVGEERVVRLYKKETLRKLLIEMFPKVGDGAWKELGEIGERVRDIGMGCLVLRIEPSSEEDGIEEKMVLPLWRSAQSLNLMLAKEERTAMLLRIFNDSTPLVNHSQGARAKSLDNGARTGGENGSTFEHVDIASITDKNTEVVEGIHIAEDVDAATSGTEAGDGDMEVEITDLAANA